jgi:hypothetical protein
VQASARLSVQHRQRIIAHAALSTVIFRTLECACVRACVRGTGLYEACAVHTYRDVCTHLGTVQVQCLQPSTCTEHGLRCDAFKEQALPAFDLNSNITVSPFDPRLRRAARPQKRIADVDGRSSTQAQQAARFWPAGGRVESALLPPTKSWAST